MTSIDTIKSVLNVTQGPAQPCNYIVNIVPPVSLLLGGSSISLTSALTIPISLLASKQLSILAESVSIPGRQFLTEEHKMFGTRRLMPYGVLYENMSITFMCTNSMIERTFFDIWHKHIIDPTSQYMKYYEDYIGTVIVQKIDNSVSPLSNLTNLVSTYVLEEAYPVTIQAQDMSYSSTDEYLKLTVEFSYARWRNTIDYASTLF